MYLKYVNGNGRRRYFIGLLLYLCFNVLSAYENKVLFKFNSGCK